MRLTPSHFGNKTKYCMSKTFFVIEDKLKEIGIELPTPPAPAGSYIPVVKTGNLAFVTGQIAMKDGKLVTPASSAILPSITRRSLMELAAKALNLHTEERPIDLRVELEDFEEVGACGTAAVLSPVGKIWFDNKWRNIYQDGLTVGPVMQELYDLLVGIQKGEVADEYKWLHEIEI